jgi:SAM-dependent methyltransferase
MDVRSRSPVTENETVVTGDVKKIDFLDNYFDCIVSLCSIEHFGLGRYGDEFDPLGDSKAMDEIFRVLKHGGILILSTTVHRCPPSIAFNAHRIYSYPAIECLHGNMDVVEQVFFSKSLGRACSAGQVTGSPFHWDIYCGCWRKQ